MSISIRVDVNDGGVDERLRKLLDGLTDRTDVHEAIGKRELGLTRDYLLAQADFRHKSAESIGGTPTGFLSRAAEQTGMRADNAAATISIRSPGIGRAAHPVTIVPTEGREFLTLPMRGIAYGRTVSQVEDIIGKRMFRPLRKGAKASGHKLGARHSATFDDGDRMHVLGVSDGSGGMNLYFALVESVTQPQDRTLLPSDDAYKTTAVAGLRDWLDYILFWKGQPE